MNLILIDFSAELTNLCRRKDQEPIQDRYEVELLEKRETQCKVRFTGAKPEKYCTEIWIPRMYLRAKKQ